MSKLNPCYTNKEMLEMVKVVGKEILSVFPMFPNKKTLKSIENFSFWLDLLKQKLESEK